MKWTNSSVVRLGVSDPAEHVVSRAREMVFRALEEGWAGPPFDPVALAEMHGIETVPSADVVDARIVTSPSGAARIEFNPDRPSARIRFSICHEIAHTLFPDFRETIRNRDLHSLGSRDSWQLECLCNRAAAEFLLPIGSVQRDLESPIQIDDVLSVRKQYAASSEAVLLRIASLAKEPLLVFAAKHDSSSQRYLVEYAVSSAVLQNKISSGMLLPPDSLLDGCTAIGYVTKGQEKWDGVGVVRIECLGVPGYPGEPRPRVVGIAKPTAPGTTVTSHLRFVTGDATRLQGRGRKLLLQVVNDEAKSWGRGFPLAVAKRWPSSLSHYTAAVRRDPAILALGNIISCRLDQATEVISLVAQKGYGRSLKPRIRYGALTEALSKVAEYARRGGASVHMPRIATGGAGGSWLVVEEIVRETLLRRNVPVTVYDLPQTSEIPRQLRLN